MLVSSCGSFGICLTWSICRLSTSKVGWTEIDGQTISDEGTGGDTTSAIEKQRRSPSQTEPCPSDSTASIWNFWLLESVTVSQSGIKIINQVFCKRIEILNTGYQGMPWLWAQQWPFLLWARCGWRSSRITWQTLLGCQCQVFGLQDRLVLNPIINLKDKHWGVLLAVKLWMTMNEWLISNQAWVDPLWLHRFTGWCWLSIRSSPFDTASLNWDAFVVSGQRFWQSSLYYISQGFWCNVGCVRLVRLVC